MGGRGILAYSIYHLQPFGIEVLTLSLSSPTAALIGEITPEFDQHISTLTLSPFWSQVHYSTHNAMQAGSCSQSASSLAICTSHAAAKLSRMTTRTSKLSTIDLYHPQSFRLLFTFGDVEKHTTIRMIDTIETRSMGAYRKRRCHVPTNERPLCHR